MGVRALEDPNKKLVRERAQAVLASRQLSKACWSVMAAAGWRDRRFARVAWQEELAELCDGLIDSALEQDGRFACVSAPPRHGKTELLGRAMPIRAFLAAAERDEVMSILYVTSTSKRAVEVSSRVRHAIERLYAQTGDERWAAGRIWTTTEWETKGGHQWVGTGWSGSTGGIGCRLLIMDDLIGTAETYRSAVTRARIRRVIEEDLLSRVMDNGAAIHMETRRGVSDSTAYLLTSFPDTWEEHTWRCLDEANDYGRDVSNTSHYLWPEKFGARWRKRNAHLTDRSSVWLSLYQQKPVSEGGTHVEPQWLTYTYSEPLTAMYELADRIVVGVDLAATGKTTSDHCVFTAIAVRGAFRDVLEVLRFQGGFVEQKRRLKDFCSKHGAMDVLVELAAGGDAIVDDLQSEVPGIRGQRATTDKLARLTPHLGALAAGQVRVPKVVPRWLLDWRAEMENFTGIDGEEDDQVDSFGWAMVAAGTGGISCDAYVDADW